MKRFKFMFVALALSLLPITVSGQSGDFVMVEIHTSVSEGGKMHAPSISVPAIMCLYNPREQMLHLSIDNCKALATIKVFHLDSGEEIFNETDCVPNYQIIPLISPGEYRINIKLSTGSSFFGRLFAESYWYPFNGGCIPW